MKPELDHQSKIVINLESKKGRGLLAAVDALTAYFRQNHSNIFNGLNPPTTTGEIDDFQRLIGRKLNTEFKMLYLIANGQRDGGIDLFPNGYRFMSLDGVKETWLMLKGVREKDVYWSSRMVSGPIKNAWWLPGWVPFAENICGDMLCVDLQPTHLGKTGQVIHFVHDDVYRNCKGDSLTNFFIKFAAGLRTGEYEFDAELESYEKIWKLGQIGSE